MERIQLYVRINLRPRKNKLCSGVPESLNIFAVG